MARGLHWRTDEIEAGDMGVDGRLAVAQKRILIVDNYPQSLRGLKSSLTAGGWLVETATDGWQAIMRVKESTFDLAIIDVDLPSVSGLIVSGWDLVRICRAFHPAISIVVMSAEGGPEVTAQAESLKVSDVLEKPIDLEQLKSIVRTIDP